MSFLIRSAESRDLQDLVSLASQFSLLNLPPEEEVLQEKIERSMLSFAGKVKKKADGEYLFVLEDRERGRIIGSSLILAKHGTKDVPHLSFQVLRQEHFSKDLGIGFIHQVLRLRQTKDGPTEIGGLLVDRSYRSRPEKLGKQISLMRFIFMGMHPERFESKLLCEFAPPLTREGRSEFWEALGRRFTGLNYDEADAISQKHKEFIQSLFPQVDIYMSLLDSRARQVVGQVSQSTRPAQHLLESLGFRYLQEVDPFDGGPHFGAETAEIPLVKNGKWTQVVSTDMHRFDQIALVGLLRDGKFLGCQTAYEETSEGVVFPLTTVQQLQVKPGDKVFFSKVV